MKKIVLCGSKKFIPKFFELEEILKNKGYEVVVPREFIVDMPKKEASLLHFSEIEKDNVDALLIVNESKNGIDNYIGANGFAELAYGFYKGKKIFLLNDVYEPYEEEIVAWNVIPLKGKIDDMNKYLNAEKEKMDNKDNVREIEKGKIYRHFKGKLYYVLDIVIDCESNNDVEYKKIVIYRALYGEHLTWARPYEMFASEVDHEKYPEVTQKYRFEECVRDYEKEGLKAFLSLKFYEGDTSKKLVDDITRALEKLNIHTFTAARDIQKYGEVKELDMANFMPKYVFPEIETSDIIIIEYSESGAGLGMVADHAYCHNIPLYLIAKKGSNISKTVNSVAEKVIFYDDINDITNEFKKLIDNNELKTNHKTLKLTTKK